MFIKYPHLERFGTTEVQDIDLGECYVFPKIDGTNASIWFENGIHCGSRTRELSLESDNAGFMEWTQGAKNIQKLLVDNKHLRLYGEWLVPHALRSYRDDAWRQFYVFDVATGEGEDMKFLHYEEYKPLLEEYDIPYIPCIFKVKDGTIDVFESALDKNVYLLKDGEGFGEGVVVKNYEYKNKYGRTTWAKMVRNEFKDLHAKANNTTEVANQKLCEEEIVKKYVTLSLIEKEKAKIELEEDGWTSRKIPKLLNIIFYNLVREESWNFIKEFNFPRLDFKLLQKRCFQQVKELAPSLF